MTNKVAELYSIIRGFIERGLCGLNAREVSFSTLDAFESAVREEALQQAVIDIDKARAAARAEGAEQVIATIAGLDDGQDWAFWCSIMDLKECPHYVESDNGCLDRCGMGDCAPLDPCRCRLLLEMGYLDKLRMRHVLAPKAPKG